MIKMGVETILRSDPCKIISNFPPHINVSTDVGITYLWVIAYAPFPFSFHVLDNGTSKIIESLASVSQTSLCERK